MTRLLRLAALAVIVAAWLALRRRPVHGNGLREDDDGIQPPDPGLRFVEPWPPTTTPSLTNCGRCGHPMHWHGCGLWNADLTSACGCRNDFEMATATA